MKDSHTSPSPLNSHSAGSPEEDRSGLAIPSRIDRGGVVLAGDRRPMSNYAFVAAVREAIGFGRSICLPVADFEIWRHRDPGAARSAPAT